MTYATKKHPALPPNESGWFLYRSNPTINQGRTRESVWKAGYHGKLHPHAWRNFKTESEAIEWINDKVAEYSGQHAHSDIMQRFLCGNWRAA